MNTFEKIYAVVSKIPYGKVATYGQVALLAGNPHWSRVVGYALHVNPQPGVIPCFRVVMRDGGLSSGFAFGGMEIQKQLLESEGIEFDADSKVIMSKYQWIPQQND